jgi:hypothetical protein
MLSFGIGESTPTPAERELALTVMASPDGLAKEQATPQFRTAFRQVALDNEVLDPRETYLNDFQEMVGTVQWRWGRLSEAPPLAAAWVLPSYTELNDAIALNRAYYRQLSDGLALNHDRYDLIREAMAEADELYAVYDAARDARCDYYFVSVKRAGLKRLVELTGSVGPLPPPLPLWRFHDGQ